MQIKAPMRKALVVVQSHINSQMDSLNEAYSFLKKNFSVLDISNIFLKYQDPEKGPSSRGQLVFAISLGVAMSPEELNRVLINKMKEQPNAVDYFFVMFEEETRMLPTLTLPHPDLHKVPYWLIPAAEVWGDAPHPVLERRLAELATDNEWGAWGEFFAQGKTLADFYYKHQK